MKTQWTKGLLAAAAGIGGALMLAGQAHALLLDDMLFTGSSTTGEDTTPSSGSLTATRGTGGSGFFVNPDGTRNGELYVYLVGGDGASTEDCGNCMSGHTVIDANSTAHHYFKWELPDGASPFDKTVDHWIELDYEADVAGMDLFLSFDDNSGARIGSFIQLSDLAATGLGLTNFETVKFELSENYSGIASIRLDVFSNGGSYVDETGWLGTTALGLGDAAIGLDTNFRNFVQQVPVPGTLVLLGLGVAGLGWQRRHAA